MDLILWRHAEAEAGDGKRPDHKRRLTPRGEKQARGMAGWLRERLSGKVAVLVSPTERTRQTAHALGLPFEIEPKIGPSADVADLLAAIGWPEGKVSRGGTAILIGHQPTLGRLAALLLAGDEADWAVKKGAVWWFTARVRDGEIGTVLKAVAHPDLL
ncbi:MAG: histidine phosphatase family protein [Rhodocyclaceae bacterium]|jgi:phosphohistidine phosphatase|nr:histidine phosphatase family protein [Rhodocyclaceae bacterium]MBK6676714.1 histidine phosphatase family protein [Rhodocyclaceae bacterium]MBK9309339.1 histidine phosphatase family protein [Rhodocyclaceae bacterium]MBK9955567.1 histidine phosphatase family protein [Rhodocyclaceae bacterium]